MRSLPSLLLTGFYYLFGLIFLWLFLSITFNNQTYPFKTLHIVFYVSGWLILTCYVYKAIKHAEHVLQIHERKIASLWMLALFSAHLFCGYWLAVATGWDTEAVFRGAITLKEQGNLGGYSEYFHIFPHNLGATSALQFVFTICSALGFQDYHWIATVYNVISINLGILFVYLICRELKSIKVAFLSLWLSSCCIPLYFYTPIFYSDTLSLPFVMMTYYVYLQILKSANIKQQFVRACAFAIVCTLGTLIKFTVIIVAIAVLIDLIMRGNLKKYWPATIVAISLFYTFLSGFNYYRYNHLLDKNLSEQKQVPYTHWVMMGLSGNGAYNGSDYEYTYTFSTRDARAQANIERIGQRLKEYGVGGYLEFLHRKQQLNFGSGIYGVNEMIDDNPLRPNSLHQVAIEGGKYYETFKHMAHGYHILLFLLIIFSAVYDAAAKTRGSINKLVVRLSITGIFIFLALWEANSRYILNFMPMFIACAALGFPELYRVAGIVKHSLQQHIREIRNSDTQLT